MTFIPCVATVVVIRLEARAWKWVAFSLGLALVTLMVAEMVACVLGRLAFGVSWRVAWSTSLVRFLGGWRRA